MKTLILLSLAFASCSLGHADERGKLIFSDNFERTASQQTNDEVGNGWTTNSASRAGGNKQVDLKNGAMHIAMHPTADHAVSVAHEAGFRDGTVELRFMLEDAKDSLGVDFADLQCKEVWAGHLFKIDVGVGKVSIMDSKFGTMSLENRNLRLAGKLTPEQQKAIAALKKNFTAPIATGKWHSLSIRIVGDIAAVALDGKPIGSFASAAFAHPTKRMIRLGVPRKAVVDDVMIFALTATGSPGEK
ncbi:MAG: hypothetical protein Q8N18_03860 [Opitutaceae bacterium]|nr:hypothetical protein [Opitutaceae bacterium]